MKPGDIFQIKYDLWFDKVYPPQGCDIRFVASRHKVSIVILKVFVSKDDIYYLCNRQGSSKDCSREFVVRQSEIKS